MEAGMPATTSTIRTDRLTAALAVALTLVLALALSGGCASPRPPAPRTARPPAPSQPAPMVQVAEPSPVGGARLSLLHRADEADAPAVAGVDAAAVDAAAPGLAGWQPPVVGIQACDEYLQKYVACLASRLPPAAQAQVRQGLRVLAQAWRRAASTPGARQSLETACQTAYAAARQAMSSFNCSW